MMSMYQPSQPMLGYFSETFRAMSRNLPSVVFTMLALVTTVTVSFPVRCAWAKAASIIRSEPWLVMTRKSMPRSSVTLTPWLPTAYMSSVFSRKKVQSMPSRGMRTGRMLANRSSSFRMDTLALSRLGQPSPLSGRVGRALQGDVALLDIGQHVVGDALQLLGPVLDGEALDGAELHLAAGHLVFEQELQHPLGLGRDERADAVAPDHADHDGADLAVVDPVLLGLEALHPFQLLGEDGAELLLGCLYGLGVCHAGSFTFLPLPSPERRAPRGLPWDGPYGGKTPVTL